MEHMAIFLKQYKPSMTEQTFRVPASKSLLNRALVLAAFSDRNVSLRCGSLSEDTRAMLSCLRALGIGCEETDYGIIIHGCNARPPVKNAEIDVKSAGTAARFLPVALAFCGGDYRFLSSAQMSARPMEILALLESKGARFEWLGNEYSFPFRMFSDGLPNGNDFTVDTSVSTQYASGILLAAPFKAQPLSITLTGNRTDGGYIAMTLDLLEQFGARRQRRGDTITVLPGLHAPAAFDVEADVSGACYFFALALLFSLCVHVRGVRLDGTQSDVKFLRLLESKGVVFTQTDDGLTGDARNVKSFTGFDADFGDFSDQTLTAAALAPFASSPSHLRNVEHIRKQECDRVHAAVKNVNALGGVARTDGETITIYPVPLKGGTVETFGDHRVAMSFALAALKTGNTTVDDPACCKKTFENYFDLIASLQ